MKPMDRHCYINSISLVSCQQPLSDEWFTNPCLYAENYIRAQEPDSKGFIVPSEARRMSKILKRTICTSITALNNSGEKDPDAIITGTGMGCMENSEKFLIDLARFGENCLKPTLFMQSTHNTISSLIAIVLKCHGYNNTYSHKDISFESALLDGWLQIKSSIANNALVGSHDEITPFMALILQRTHPEYRFISETSMSAVISSTKKENSICEIIDVKILHRASIQEIADCLTAKDYELMLLGTNGNPDNDAPYDTLLDYLATPVDTLNYKHIFGENFSASAAGFYAAATILKRQEIPSFMWRETKISVKGLIDRVTILNCANDSTWTIIKLKRI